MEPVSTVIVTYVSLKFLDQFLIEQGYGRVKKLFFPQKKYRNQLISVIYKTIDHHEKSYSYTGDDKKFPFYHSQDLFEYFNQHVLFKTEYSTDGLLKKIEANPKIIIPSEKELRSFYQTLVDKINNDKELKRLFIDENYKFKIFEILQYLEKVKPQINDIEDGVTTLKNNLIFKPDEEWFKGQCQSSIQDLGNRYTPELNFELEISKIFDGLGRTREFEKQLTRKVDRLIIKGKKLLKDNPEIKEDIDKLKTYFDEFFTLFNSIEFCGNAEIPNRKLLEVLSSISKKTEGIQRYYLKKEQEEQKEKKDTRFNHKYRFELKNISELEYEIVEFEDYLNSTVSKLANNPILVLDGAAGIGKSHMIGDIVSKRIANRHESVFILGQHFLTDEDPWTQIFKRLQINAKSHTFLDTINNRGKESGKRILIYIDAINEGRGKYFWANYIKSFIYEIRSYDWIGLVLSIRSTYKNLIFPEDEIDSLKIIEHTLYGFRNVEYEASQLFFNNYQIELPKVPLFHPEFQNPLFLKLFCEGISKSGLNAVPDGLQGISSIIHFFIKSIMRGITIIKGPTIRIN